MGLISSILTLTWITETSLGFVGNRVDESLASKLNVIKKTVKEYLSDTDIPLNNDLQKAVECSHWLATKVFCEELKKRNHPSDILNRIFEVANEQIKLIKSKDYIQSQEVNNSDFESIILGNEQNINVLLKRKILDFHVKDLSHLLNKRERNHASFENFEQNIRNGLDNLDWFNLACSFLNDSLIGENNKAKDAFHNYYLAKISKNAEENQRLLVSITNTMNGFVDAIGKERFEEFKAFLKEDLADIKVYLIEVKTDVKEIKEDVKQILKVQTEIKDCVIEMSGSIKKKLYLNEFPEYNEFLKEIDILNNEFEGKNSEKQEILNFLKEETDERKKKHFEKELNSIEYELLQIDKKRDNKRVDFDSFRAYIETTWLHFYSENIQNTKRLEKAKDLFEKGDLKGAKVILELQDLQKDVDTVNSLDKELKAKKESLAQEFLIRANITVIEKESDMWFDEAKSHFLQALDLNMNYDTCFSYAFFLKNHKQVFDSIIWYNNAKQYAENIYKKAIVLGSLGLLQTEVGDFESAEINNRECLKIYVELNYNSMQSYLLDVALILNNLGLLQRAKENFKEAESVYIKCLSIYNQLEESKPNEYQSYVAGTLANLGSVLHKMGRHTDAEFRFVEALQIYRKLKELTNPEYLNGLAVTLNSLGNLYFTLKKFDKMEKNCKEALEIYKGLAKNNPYAYLSSVAMMLNNLGNAQIAQNLESKYLEAENNNIEAEKIYRDLAKVSPKLYLPSVAMVLNNLGNMYSVKKNWKGAEEKYQEIVQIFENSSDINVQTYLPYVLAAFNNLIVLYKTTKELGKVPTNYEKLLEVRFDLVQQKPDIYQVQQAETLINFAFFCLKDAPNEEKSLALSLEYV